MVSPTAQTRVIRTHKAKRAGAKRKNKINNQGSTRSQAELFGSAKADDAVEQK